MILFEDEDLRIEAHVTEQWLITAGTDWYKCGEQWSNGDPCSSYSALAVHGNVCHRMYAKAKAVKFICQDCAKGDHTQCTKGSCDCQHRTQPPTAEYWNGGNG